MKEKSCCGCCSEEETTYENEKAVVEEPEIVKLKKQYRSYRNNLEDLLEEKTHELINVLKIVLDSVVFDEETKEEIEVIIEKLEKFV